MMKIQVAIPALATTDFDLSGGRPVPFLSAPSTPRCFGDYTLSAPTSPSKMREFYSYFEEKEKEKEKLSTPRSPIRGDDDFAFDFSAELEKTSLTADELFAEGRIRPLDPPPRLQIDGGSPISSPRSPIEKGKKIIRDAFSPRKKKVQNPFVDAAKNIQNKADDRRGRERTPGSASSTRRTTRSLSPLRVAAYPWEEEEKQQQKTNNQSTPNSKTDSPSTIPSSTPKSSSKKWRLKDLFLFRSVSDGRAYGKDPLRKYTATFKRQDDVKDASFRSTDSTSSGSSSRRRGPISAHELHYTANKAASDNLKKKTFLPYKRGILGRFAFNPAAHALSNGFGSFTR